MSVDDKFITKVKSWDVSYEKVQETIKESFWGDFLFGGLLISGIFIIVDNLNPRFHFIRFRFTVDYQFYMV